MDNNQQVNIVKKALELEIFISNNETKLNNLCREKFNPPPDKPIRNIVNRQYPQIVPQVKVNWILVFLPLMVSLALCFVGKIWFILLGSFLLFPALIWIPVYYFMIYRKKKKDEIEKINNSDSYKQQCANSDIEYDRIQEEMDIVYKNQMIEYENNLLPKYKIQLENWTNSHNKKFESVKKELTVAKNALSDLYATTKIVPMHYRKIEILKYIYETISTSDYDVKYALELYERNEQKKLEEARLYQQLQANQLADEQNYLLQEQNELAIKAKRYANIAAAVGTIQRHNTNKILKDRFKK